MKPNKETIEEFRKAYFEEFGEEISKETAYEKFLNLSTLLRVILYPSRQKREDQFGRPEGKDKLKDDCLNRPHIEDCNPSKEVFH